MIGMPKLSDQGMQEYNPRPKPKPAPKPAPSWSPANSYVAPVANYQYSYSPPATNYQVNNQPVYSSGNAGSVNTNWGGGGGAVTAQSAGGGTAAATTAAAKPMSDADWLAGDTEYQNEIKGYDDTLKDFLARIATQETDFKDDYGVAVKGFGRNRAKAELGLGEDFTARGLANSGMFGQATRDQFAQFEDQKRGMTTAKDRALADFGNQRSDKQRATDTQKGNARRASLARMAQKQEF